MIILSWNTIHYVHTCNVCITFLVFCFKRLRVILPWNSLISFTSNKIFKLSFSLNSNTFIPRHTPPFIDGIPPCCTASFSPLFIFTILWLFNAWFITANHLFGDLAFSCLMSTLVFSAIYFLLHQTYTD